MKRFIFRVKYVWHMCRFIGFGYVKLAWNCSDYGESENRKYGTQPRDAVIAELAYWSD